MLKKDDLTWEQEKKLEQTFEEVNEAFQQIEEMQKNIDKITEQASKNNLFNEELLEKFDQFKGLSQAEPISKDTQDKVVEPDK